MIAPSMVQNTNTLTRNPIVSATAPSPPSSEPIDADFCSLIGLNDGLSTLDLSISNPKMYSQYCKWYTSRLDSQRLSNHGTSIETRLAAYLRLIGERGQRFHLGADSIPSAKWIRVRLGLHRNTMSKYIKDAQANKPLQLSLTVGCQLAFAAAIFPRPTKLEREATTEVLENRLDLIDDYHLTGKDRLNMVRRLTPIVYSGKNELFTVPKTYPCTYNRDEKLRPIKPAAKHTPRRVLKKPR